MNEGRDGIIAGNDNGIRVPILRLASHITFCVELNALKALGRPELAHHLTFVKWGALPARWRGETGIVHQATAP
jgi:hypothetical protein